MADLHSGRDKFHLKNNLTCLVKALERKELSVEVQGDLTIKGVLDSADAKMNLYMSEATVTNARGESLHMAKFYVRGRKIRYVIVPDEVDILQAMEWQINKEEYFLQRERAHQARSFEQRQRGKARAAERREQRDAQDSFRSPPFKREAK